MTWGSCKFKAKLGYIARPQLRKRNKIASLIWRYLT